MTDHTRPGEAKLPCLSERESAREARAKINRFQDGVRELAKACGLDSYVFAASVPGEYGEAIRGQCLRGSPYETVVLAGCLVGVAKYRAARSAEDDFMNHMQVSIGLAEKHALSWVNHPINKPDGEVMIELSEEPTP